MSKREKNREKKKDEKKLRETEKITSDKEMDGIKRSQVPEDEWGWAHSSWGHGP